MTERTMQIAFYVLLLVLPIAGLIARRPPLRRTSLSILAWIGIFAAGLIVAGQRDRFGATVGNHVEGRETRIAMAADGHFWADVAINGVSCRMLIDSGASTTAMSPLTARAAGLVADSSLPVIVNTANGQTTGTLATAATIVIGTVTMRDISVMLLPASDGPDVIGMNMLSRLAGWSVEGRTLVLHPKRPTA